MSCHDIGRGVNSVAKTVLELYEENRFDKSTARALLRACRMGVYWCDGNEDEATESAVKEGYCGLCMEKSEKLTHVFDNGLPYPDKFKVFKPYDDTAAHHYLCPECMGKALSSFFASKEDPA